MEIKFIPKAPDAAAGNQDIILEELPVLRLERKETKVFAVLCGQVEMCMALQRGSEN